LTEASLLPVRNMAEAMAVSTWNKPPKALTAPALLQVPLLSFALRAFIDRQYFSFSEFCRTKPANLPDAMDDELRDWVECVFSQIRDLELCLGCECTPTRVAPASRQTRTIHRAPQVDAQPLGGDAQHAIDAVEAVLRFAPKKLRGQTTEDLIDQLKAEIKQWQDRAVRAETRLQSVQKLVQDQIKRMR
jgi:hypothetical protein